MVRVKERSWWSVLSKAVLHLPMHMLEWWNEDHQKAIPLMTQRSWKELEKELRRTLESHHNGNDLNPHIPLMPSSEMIALIAKIQQETAELNRNNVTRTAAYKRIYDEFPEIHWALLAHMVSRNGGWSMTDLQGEWLPRLLGEQERKDLFLFLEHANAYIFQDAYPQLALYRESKRRNKNLMPLIGRFHVSRFMLPIWERFMHSGESELLSVALIINEQHYIEDRVVRDPYFTSHVVESPAFQLQSLLQLNQILFPAHSSDPTVPYRLSGLIIEDFSSLDERIHFGKDLYAILFRKKDMLSGVLGFAGAHPHTGSRQDYWPQLFSSIRRSPPAFNYKAKLENGRLRKGAPPIFSPRLEAAWKEQSLRDPDRKDWFQNEKAIGYLKDIRPPKHVDMEQEAIWGMEKLEAAVLAGQWLGWS
ncbi:DUF2515 family protein [Marinicrinis lubricantis]|uniref:DUF2515 family protein n=1 Tax=Marinicrinis lubricantis TaxID=2086470 RepID=A0ABW1IUK4_9BACL